MTFSFFDGDKNKHSISGVIRDLLEFERPNMNNLFVQFLSELNILPLICVPSLMEDSDLLVCLLNIKGGVCLLN